LSASPQEGSADGFRHTISEICQQPSTWKESALHLVQFREALARELARCNQVILTGSGSSQFAGDCVGEALQREIGRPVEVVGGGELLLRRRASWNGEPALVVSLARSGDSPESVAAVEMLLECEPETRHLVLTCNSEGRLARQFSGEGRVLVVRLPDRVNDRSLVMTSSFTNLVLATRFLGHLNRVDTFLAMVDRVAETGRHLLEIWPERLAAFVSGDIHRAVFLGDSGRFGAAREAALKMLEMTSGKIATLPQNYLALRHGPMCFIDSRTLVVCFLSSDPRIRKYQFDLVAELNAKGLGARKLIVGTGDPGAGLAGAGDLVITYPMPGHDDDLAVLDVMVGQTLGFYRCLEEGLRPDTPSENGVINRVVNHFHIHDARAASR
jgi:tagatose-6-phosphate ketose/aldose isomerase